MSKPPRKSSAAPATPVGPDDIQIVTVEDEMQRSYLDYAMSVIVARALPDVRDGLKPVHRRILYGMQSGRYLSSERYRKSARIVGDVMGKYHPHGDSAIYDAMVRMAQDFSLRVPLVDGQGNFGSIDGDPAAAMRYTEARLLRITESTILSDLDMDTVEWQPTYDDSDVEPSVLPARIPNLLINGTGGIAVGMATSVPPHNPAATIAACLAVLENKDLPEEQLFDIIGCPDFPTGGEVVGWGRTCNAYRTGSGSVLIRAKTHIEEVHNGRMAIIVDEIPYQVNKKALVEAIADCAKSSKDQPVVRIPDIYDLRDESNMEGIRIVIELKKDAQPDVVLAQLYKYTELRKTFSYNMLALNGGRPQQMSLRQVIDAFLLFRHEVVRRRSAFELRELRKRGHILSGLLKAQADIDRVIKEIRAGKDTAEAKQRLMNMSITGEQLAKTLGHWLDLVRRLDSGAITGADGATGFTEKQAEEILKLRLSRLTGLERDKLAEEAQQVITRMQELADILGNKAVLKEVVRKELAEIEFANSGRRTTVVPDDDQDFDTGALIPVEEMVVTITRTGYVKRTPLAEYKAQKRGGKGRSGVTLKDDDSVTQVISASSHASMVFITDRGQAFSARVFELPDGGIGGRGRPLVNVFKVAPGETIVAWFVIPPKEQRPEGEVEVEDGADSSEEVSSAQSAGLTVVFASSNGDVRRNRLSDFEDIKSNGKIAMRYEGETEGVRLVGVQVAQPDDDVFLVTKLGQAIRFPVADLRVMNSRTSTGVRGIKLNLEKGDEVIGMTILAGAPFSAEERAAYLTAIKCGDEPQEAGDGEDGGKTEGESEEAAVPAITLSPEKFAAIQAADQDILFVTSLGFSKRTPSLAFRQQGRGGSGLRSIALPKKAGLLTAAFPVVEGDGLVIATNEGQLIRVDDVSTIRKGGRDMRGVKVLDVAETQQIVAVSRVPNEDKAVVLGLEGEDVQAEAEKEG